MCLYMYKSSSDTLASESDPISKADTASISVRAFAFIMIGRNGLFSCQKLSDLTSSEKFQAFCSLPIRTNTFWHEQLSRAAHVVLKNLETQ